MQNLLSSIQSETNLIWTKWTNEKWFQKEILYPLEVSKEAGQELAHKIERELISSLKETFSTIIAQEVNEQGEELARSMGDFWIKTEQALIPVNIKVRTSLKGSPSMV